MILFLITQIYLAKLSDVIHPPSATYIIRAIEEAERADAECLIIEMDTPGGLDESMRDITKKILNAKIPIIVYVHPAGARCASAGVFILLSSHIAVMTPGTNIGAAHPVAMGGRQMDKEMAKKVENDAVAYIKSIATKKNRNEKWAEKAVRESVSEIAEEALKLNIIDFIADNLEDLLNKIDNYKVKLETGEKIIHTKNKEIIEIKWSFKENFLSKIANPNIAYILLMLGIWGLIFELSHPGAVFPGVFGGICLLLAFYSFKILPINYAGLAFIILGCVLLVLEVLTPTYGPLAIGGVIALALGSIMLTKMRAPFFQISKISIIIVVALTAAFFIFALGMAFRTMRRKPITGKRGLVGEIGEVKERIEPNKEGRVFIWGEWWKAISDEPIEVGEKVKVVKVENLILKVEKIRR